MIVVLALVSLGAAPKNKYKLEPEKVAPVFPVEPAWAITLDSPPSAPSAMDAGQVYVPLQSGEIVALARESGLIRWTARVETRWAPLLIDTLVIVAGSDALHALDVVDGRERWRVELPWLAAPMAAAAGRVLAITAGEMVVLKASDGGIVWKHPHARPAAHAPIAIDDLVVMVVDGSSVIALHASDGDLAWIRTLEGTLSQPVAAEDRILVGSTSNALHALEPTHGVEAWKFRTGGDVIGAAVDGDVVYFVSLDNILRAVNRGNGNQRWKTVIPTRPAAPPTAFDGVVVLSGVAPRVDGYEGTTGRAQGSYTAPADLQGAALVDPLRPYRVAMVTVSKDGRVSAVRSTPMMMHDPAVTPWTVLPGRRLGREKPPNPAS